jgi:hypothetical protein
MLNIGRLKLATIIEVLKIQLVVRFAKYIGNMIAATNARTAFFTIADNDRCKRIVA